MAIIDKKRSIGSVAKEINLQEHTIRFWETQFSQIKPIKGRGQRRYYFDKDVDLLQKIKYFLHDEGYTIKGLRKLFENNKKILKKELHEIKKAKDIDVKAFGRNAIVEAVSKLVGISKRLKNIVVKLEEV